GGPVPMPTPHSDRRGWLGHSRTQWTRNAQIVAAVLAGTPMTTIAQAQGVTRERVRQSINRCPRQANRPLYEQLQCQHGKLLVPLGVLLAHAQDFGGRVPCRVEAPPPASSLQSLTGRQSAPCRCSVDALVGACRGSPGRRRWSLRWAVL